MAASAIPAPGTEFGPCLSEDCVHRDCACSRREAAAQCRICGESIGFERLWYASVDGIEGAVHASCAEAPVCKRCGKPIPQAPIKRFCMVGSSSPFCAEKL
jgi:hypothetical protein